MLQETHQNQSLQKPSLENSIWYNGHLFSFLLNAKQTSGSFCLIHCHFRKGGEPPAHYHLNEDETFYLLEGQIRFHVGDKKFIAKPGDVVYAAKGIPHHFKIETETAKALLLISPAGIETFFSEFGVPAQSMELPEIPQGEPPAKFMQQMLKRAEELGIVWMPEF